MSLSEHFRSELNRLSDLDDKVKDDMYRLSRSVVKQFDSGGAAPYGSAYVAYIWLRLFNYLSATPLTGDESEWVKVDPLIMGRDDVEHNRRCSRVFRHGGPLGYAFDAEAVVWSEVYWTRRPKALLPLPTIVGHMSWDSRRKVKFPYDPETRKVWARLRCIDKGWARLRGKLVTS